MPNIKKNIFNHKKVKSLLLRFDTKSVPDYPAKLDVIREWKNFIQSENIYSAKETAIQSDFLENIFSKVLGYKNRIGETDEWNLNKEQLTSIDGKFADGSLGFFSNDSEDVRVVIELKDANTNLAERQHRHNDIRTPIEQAFSYQHKIGKKCNWIIVSNFKEIRLYHHSSSTEFELFEIEELDDLDNFKRFWFMLSKNNLVAKTGESTIDSLYRENEEDKQNITKAFYSEFKQARLRLFEHLKENNPYNINISKEPVLSGGEWHTILLEKAQKILDRFIFIMFCEDNRLLPENTFKFIIDWAKKSWANKEYQVWTELKGLFNAINTGLPSRDINKFNGGLFAEDNILDNLTIKNSVFSELYNFSNYDFESDIDVNILGHIFEQSISDIEELKAGIEGKEFDKKTSKRKKEGIYYTPEYITKYIVENAVGAWLEDRKKELGFYELPALSEEAYLSAKKGNGKGKAKSKAKAAVSPDVQRHLEFWNAYKEKLMNIKVLDPACGSGAFLNQCFNYLYAEGQKVNDIISSLSGGIIEMFALDRHILSNNLYGVDLNSESVEITKLSLWIKTANKHSELTTLEDNIKCGNSLIDDPEIAGEKAFNWFKEFPTVFPGYREYKKSKSKPVEDDEETDTEHITYSELDKTKVLLLKEPSYSYGPESKGYEKHGFDVIICNPPYVRADTVGEIFRKEREWLTNNYETLYEKWDLMTAFFERGLNLLNHKGFLGFIASNSITTSKFAFKLQDWIIKNVNIRSIDYYDDFEIFENVGVVPITIIIDKNEINDQNYIKKIYRLKEFGNYKTKQIDLSLNRNLDNNELRSLIFKKEYSKINISIENVMLGEICYISKGMVINADEIQYKGEFTKDDLISNVKDEIHSRIYIEGKNIKRYKIDEYKYLEWNTERVPNKLSRQTFPELYDGENILRGRVTEGIFDNTGIICNDSIVVFKKYVDLNGINNLSINNSITKNNLKKREELEEISKHFDLKYLLAILNSKFAIKYLNNVRRHRLINYFYPDDFRKLPIPSVSPEAQQPFIALADIMLEKNKELLLIRKTYFEFFTGQFKINKPTTKLQDWYLLSFDEFVKELEKAKVKLSTLQKFDLKTLFDRESGKALKIRTIIDETDKKIDKMVYELYRLTEEEIRIVEEV